MLLGCRIKTLLALSFMLVGTVTISAQDQIAELTLNWQIKTLQHQNEANDVFIKNGFL